MISLQKIKCSRCKAQYIIGWLKFDKSEEYCPNCGEQGGLIVISEDCSNITSSNIEKIKN